MSHSKALIVTGGSGSIGSATSLKAAKLGYQVCVCYFENQRDAENVVEAIRITGGNAIAVRVDTSNENEVRSMFDICEEQFGRVTHLVNNAGIVGQQCRVVDLSLSVLRHVFDVNVIGYFLCAKEAIYRMSMERGGNGGAIVNVSSRAAELGSPNEWVHYAASKGAIDTMTVGLAREVASEGIRVNAVNPGLIDTKIHASVGAPDRVEKLKHTVPMGRPGTAEEVADAIMFLISDSASYISGVCLDVSGAR